MISKFEITATSEEIRQIKREVYKLVYASDFKVNVRKIKGYDEPKKCFISLNENSYDINFGGIKSLESKVEKLKVLRYYVTALRVRMFENTLLTV